MTSETAIDRPTATDIRMRDGRLEIAPHNCFACGSLNTHGLQLELHAANDVCWTELVLDARFEGWAGIAHGGIVCTVLDEVMAWALVEHDLWGVTARMAVEFKRPLPIGTRVRGEGHVVEARRRLVTTRGVLFDEARTVLATAEGLYVGASEARKAELKSRYAFRIVPERGADRLAAEAAVTATGAGR
ncbi:MAG: PaaI family thioesterase [Chloroflexota bacterium]